MKQEPVNRRQFAKKLAVGTAALPLAACSAKPPETEDKTVAAKDSRLAAAANSGTSGESKAADSPSEADLLLAVVQQRYPDKRLNEKALHGIREELTGDLTRSKELSAYPLKNADEPGFVFAAYRGDESDDQ